MSQYDAVIFDLGETLLDIGRRSDRELFADAARHAHRFFTERGDAVPPPKRFRHILRWGYLWALLKGLPWRREIDASVVTRRALSRMGVPFSDDDWAAIAMEFYQGYAGGYGLFDGIVEFLNGLKEKGVRLALLSNTVWRGPYMDHSLRELGILDLFDERLYSADFGVRKPAPSIFREMLRRLDLPPQRVLMVGDGLRNDIRPAARLGMGTVWINWPERPHSDRKGRIADRVAHNAQGMMAAVRELTDA